MIHNVGYFSLCTYSIDAFNNFRDTVVTVGKPLSINEMIL